MGSHPPEHDEPTRKLSELSEKELLQREFFASDPESLAGMTEVVPADEEPDIEYYYNVGPRGFKARCVYCGFPNHNVGIVVCYPSGVRNMVGRNCAEKHHGADFERQIIDFDAAIDRQSYVRRKMTLLEAGRHIAAAFAELHAHPAVSEHDRVHRELRISLPDLAAGLTVVAKGDGKLVIERIVRDEAGEKARKARLGDRFDEVRRRTKEQGGEWQMFKEERQDFGMLAGAVFFGTGANMSRRLREIEGAIQKITRGLVSRDNLHAGHYRTAFVKLTEQREALEREFDRLDALQAAFAPGNLTRIAQWGNGQAGEWARRTAELAHYQL